MVYIGGSIHRLAPRVGEDANYEYSIPRPNATQQPPKIRKRDRDRAEELRLAGGPKPSLRARAVELAQERGVVRTRDLTDIGIPRCYLARFPVSRNRLTEKKSRQVNMLEHVPAAKPLRTLAGHALALMCDEGLLIKVGYGIYRATDREAA